MSSTGKREADMFIKQIVNVPLVPYQETAVTSYVEACFEGKPASKGALHRDVEPIVSQLVSLQLGSQERASVLGDLREALANKRKHAK